MPLFVRSKYTQVGFHYWDKAPEKVAFLRNPHRHRFIFSAAVEVTDSDRQVEFFTLQAEMHDIVWFGAAFQDLRDQHKGAPLSCERMAELIGIELKARDFNVIEVSVSEDDENEGIWTG